ncbi:MAG: DeoR/GlpR family DNA-binding transcription regulator [Acidimicrobiales bacterium]
MKGERHLRILTMLGETGRAEVGELSEALGVAQVTIRRDLRELDRQGLLLSVHGGALAKRGTGFEVSYAAKLGQNREEKLRIGRAACRLCQPGDTVLLDAGTTLGAMVAQLDAGHLTVITNALSVVNLLARRAGTELFVIGGRFRGISEAFLGPSALEALGSLRVDRAFVGAEAMSPGLGAQVPDADDAAYKRAAVRAAREVVLLADHTKFEAERLFSFAGWDEVDGVITGSEASEKSVADLRARGVEVTLA